MDNIHVTNYKKLLRSGISIGEGKTALCYMGKDGKVVKIYKGNYKSNYLLKDPYFDEKLEMIGAFSNDTFIGPEKLVYTNGKLIGYEYEYKKGKDFEDVMFTTKFSKLIANFGKVLDDLERTSKCKFLLGDLHSRNIIFDNGIYYFIDLDRGVFSSSCSEEEAYVQNLRFILSVIIGKIYNLKPNEKGEYKNLDVLSFFNANNFDLNILKELFEAYQEVCNCEDPTLHQIRKHTLKGKIDI